MSVVLFFCLSPSLCVLFWAIHSVACWFHETEGSLTMQSRGAPRDFIDSRDLEFGICSSERYNLHFAMTCRKAPIRSTPSEYLRALVNTTNHRSLKRWKPTSYTTYFQLLLTYDILTMKTSSAILSRFQVRWYVEPPVTPVYRRVHPCTQAVLCMVHLKTIFLWPCTWCNEWWFDLLLRSLTWES